MKWAGLFKATKSTVRGTSLGRFFHAWQGSKSDPVAVVAQTPAPQSPLLESKDIRDALATIPDHAPYRPAPNHRLNGFIGKPFLRSPHPDGPCFGVITDDIGNPYDGSAPSRLEQILRDDPLDDTRQLDRARAAIEWQQLSGLCKYTPHSVTQSLENSAYVLVVDQAAPADAPPQDAQRAAAFHEMLVFAQEEYPGHHVLIWAPRPSPQGHRSGYLTQGNGEHASLLPHIQASSRVGVLTHGHDPWALLSGASAVFCVDSHVGFEAILAGHNPRIFGQPFYAGWGLSQDQFPITRRQRKLTRAQLYAGVMLIYCSWFHPLERRGCRLEDVLATLEAQNTAQQRDRSGYFARDMRRWKRRPLRAMFGGFGRIHFTQPKAAIPILDWGPKQDTGTWGIEDGFIRSRGLGADLVAPLSLVMDDQGIYFDPNRPSMLEDLIAKRAHLKHWQRHRIERVLKRISRARLSKYNLVREPVSLPPGHRILVPGQVENDASIQLGAQHTVLELLEKTRAANPDACIIFKPHPDVEAGLRRADTTTAQIKQYADIIAINSDPIALIEAVDEVWTLTSQMGFEALIRGKPVTCLGTPFYAGWGLTTDLVPAPDRRQARPDLAGLAYACLIDYPRYHDPVSGQTCSIETILTRLETENLPGAPLIWRGIAWGQRRLSRFAYLWR